MVRHQEPLLPAHEHDASFPPLPATQCQVRLAEFAFDSTERRPESLPMSKIALVRRAPARFRREEPKAGTNNFAIEVGRQFGIIRRQVMNRQGTRKG